MEYELENKKFFISNFADKKEMNNEIHKYMLELKNKYKDAIITKEFYKGNGILVRATRIDIINKNTPKGKNKEELQKEEVRIKEKGINGLGENVYREREHDGGTQRERAGR